MKAGLVKIWKIPADHIIANGKGKIIEPRIRYRPNRRCDFFFDKQKKTVPIYQKACLNVGFFVYYCFKFLYQQISVK